MERPLILSLRTGTTLVEAPASRIRLQSPFGAITLDSSSPGLRLALQMLASSGAAEHELADLVLASDGAAAVPRFYYQLEQLRSLALISYSFATGDGIMVTLEPVSPSFRLSVPAVAAEQKFVLSRFAYCHRLKSALVVESPLSRARAILHGPAGGSLLAQLAEPRSSLELAAAVHGMDEQTARQAFGLLSTTAFICPAREDGSTAEDEGDALAPWEFHDLLFHARSRPGRHDSPAGATYRFLGRVAPLPAIKPRMSDDIIPLFRPDLDRLLEDDLPLTRVIEQRTSVREHGAQPITAALVGELLYRTARVRSVTEPGPANASPYAVSSRPYPGGGAAYELEIYLTVNSCDGIAAGLYHYDAAEHALSRISGPTTQTESLLHTAAGASGMGGKPQILLTLAARFQRLSWKYETIAYAAVLKNVGVLYQTMYLVATAMGLAPCALGSGDSDVFAQAAGLRYLEESSVGEFMLGSRR